MKKIYNTKTNYSKHPPKPTMQEFGKTAFPTFGPSVCDERFCSISLKLSKRNIQNIPAKRPCKNFAKRLPQLSDHLLEKKQKGCTDIFPKHPRKTANQEFRKTASPTFGPSFAFFACFSPICKSAA